MSDEELIRWLRGAAHDRCKAMRPAGYPRGVKDLSEWKAADRIEKLRAKVDSMVGLLDATADNLAKTADVYRSEKT